MHIEPVQIALLATRGCHALNAPPKRNSKCLSGVPGVPGVKNLKSLVSGPLFQFLRMMAKSGFGKELCILFLVSWISSLLATYSKKNH